MYTIIISFIISMAVVVLVAFDALCVNYGLVGTRLAVVLVSINLLGLAAFALVYNVIAAL